MKTFNPRSVPAEGHKRVRKAANVIRKRARKRRRDEKGGEGRKKGRFGSIRFAEDRQWEGEEKDPFWSGKKTGRGGFGEKAIKGWQKGRAGCRVRRSGPWDDAGTLENLGAQIFGYKGGIAMEREQRSTRDLADPLKCVFVCTGRSFSPPRKRSGKHALGNYR